MDHSEGPFIQAACFAEMVLRDDTGVFSLIRIIDRVSQTAAGPNPPEKMSPFHYPLRIFISLKSGKALGHSEICIVPELPNGETLDPIRLTAHFEGGEHGFSAVINFDINFSIEGLYWFEVYVEGKHVTSMPLRIIYDRRFINSPLQIQP